MNFYRNSKAPGVPVYDNASLFPPVSYQGALAEAADTNTLYSFDNGTWVVIAAPTGFSGVTSLNALTGSLTLVAGTDISITPAGSTITIASTAVAGANRNLSNLLSPTAVNQDLLPGIDLSVSLGSPSKRWLTGSIATLTSANINAQGSGDLTIATSGVGSVLYLAPNNVVDFSNKPSRNMSVLGLNAGGFDLFLRQAVTPSASYTVRFPPAQGAASQTLVNDGSGNLSWGSASALGAYVNGGNAFGGNATIGLTDNFKLDILTNNVVAQTINADGTIYIPNNTGVGSTPDPNTKLIAINSSTDQPLTVGFGFNAITNSTVDGFHGTYGGGGQIEVSANAGITNTAVSNALASIARRGNTLADAGTVEFLSGHYSSVVIQGVNPTAVTNNVVGFFAQMVADSGSIGNMYDILVNGANITGATVTNRYGIYVNDDDIGVKNNYLSGRTVLGGPYATPTSVLEVSGDIKMKGATSGYVAMQSPAAPTSYTLTFPDDAGASGEVLSTDGTGILSWVSNSTTPTGDPNTVAFFDGAGDLSDQTDFTWDGSTLSVPGNINPSVNDAFGLGDPSFEWASLYVNTVFGNNTLNLTSLVGDLTAQGDGVVLLANTGDITGTSSAGNITFNAAAGSINLNTTTGPVYIQGDSIILSDSAAANQITFTGTTVTPTSSLLTMEGSIRFNPGNTYDIGTGVTDSPRNSRARVFIANDGGTAARLVMDGTSAQTAPNGTAVGGVFRTQQLGDNVALFSTNSATANATASGTVIIQSGNRTAGTGNSGDVNLQPGISSGGTQGSINTRSNFLNLRNNAATVAATTGNAQELRFFGNANNTNYVGLKAGTLSANTTYTLPTADGTSGQFLRTNGAGVLSFATPADTGITELTGDVTAGPGSGSQVATLAAIQGNPVNAASPNPGDVLEFDGTEWVPTPITIPGFVQYTKSFSDFSVAANTNSITLFSLPAATIIEQIVIKQSASFTGGAISAYTISVGISGNDPKYASAFDVFQAPGSAIAQLSTSPGFEDFSSPVTITVTATSTGDTLDNASAGSVDIYVLTRSIV